MHLPFWLTIAAEPSKSAPAIGIMDTLAPINPAGVGRVTVYKHFPDDSAMFRACSDHWIANNPPPDFTQALTEPDELKRAAAVFRLLYDDYRRSYDMIGKVLRDAKTMPELVCRWLKD